MTGRWEKPRGAWLMRHSRPGTSKRRRAELLRQRGRRLSQTEIGVDDAGFHEDVTPPLFRRMLQTEEGSSEQLARWVLVPALFAVTGLLLGPAMLIALGLYGVMWALSPRIGRLWSWPWYLGSLVLLAIGVLLLDFSDLVAVTPWPLGVEVGPQFLPVFVWAHLVLGLALTGLYIGRCGWRAVKPRSARSKTGPGKNKDGTFKRVADKDLVEIVPFQSQQAPAVTEDEGDNPFEVIDLRAREEEEEDNPAREDPEPVFEDHEDLEFEVTPQETKGI